MLSKEFEDIIDRDFEVKLSKRQSALKEQIKIAQNTAAVNGWGRSGHMAKKYQDLYSEALEKIFNDLWDSVYRLLGVYQIAPTKRLAMELKDLIARKIEPIVNEFDHNLQHRIKLTGLSDRISLTLDEAHALIIKRAGVEVDRTIQELKSTDVKQNVQKSLLNIERSVKRNRMVIINYSYQHPLVAWEVVKQRELVEGRHIPKEAFIDQLFAALENVRDAQKMFGRDIGVWFVERNYASDDTRVLIDISNIDAYISIPFTKSQLRKLLQ
jgi:hypothetical protein